MFFGGCFRKDRPNNVLQITPSRLVAAFTRSSALASTSPQSWVGWGSSRPLRAQTGTVGMNRLHSEGSSIPIRPRRDERMGASPSRARFGMNRPPVGVTSKNVRAIPERFEASQTRDHITPKRVGAKSKRE
jgi:hypothetical protein